MCKKWNGAIMSSLIGKYVCVTSGVNDHHLYVFKVEIQTKTKIGFINKYGKQLFSTKHLIIVSDFENVCLDIQSKIESLDGKMSKLGKERRDCIEVYRNKLSNNPINI